MQALVNKILLLLFCSAFSVESYVSLNAAELNAKVVDQSGKILQDAVIYLTKPDGGAIENSKTTEVVDQINKQFVQRVKIITVGSQISFPNKDDIHHHVYSFSEPKSFELPLYEGIPSEMIDFPQTGVVSLGCNIHDWMKGYVVVVDTPYYAKTDKEGQLTISEIPIGSYTLNTWHPEIHGKISQETIKIQEGSNPISQKIKTKAKIKARRAPRGRNRAY